MNSKSAGISAMEVSRRAMCTVPWSNSRRDGLSRIVRPGVSMVAASLVAAVCLGGGAAHAQVGEGEYAVQPGDLLQISVWKEPDLVREVLVRPDGGISFPLVGDIDARGLTVTEIRDVVSQGISRYIPDPVVTVSIEAIEGNVVFVIGQVEAPGQFVAARPIDVMQALSMAGGMTPFAAKDSIRILRREGGEQVSIRFRYSEVAEGRNLEQNVILRGGDTVIVP